MASLLASPAQVGLRSRDWLTVLLGTANRAPIPAHHPPPTRNGGESRVGGTDDVCCVPWDAGALAHPAPVSGRSLSVTRRRCPRRWNQDHGMGTEGAEGHGGLREMHGDLRRRNVDREIYGELGKTDNHVSCTKYAINHIQNDVQIVCIYAHPHDAYSPRCILSTMLHILPWLTRQGYLDTAHSGNRSLGGRKPSCGKGYPSYLRQGTCRRS